MRDSLDSCFPDCWRTVGGGLRLVTNQFETVRENYNITEFSMSCMLLTLPCFMPALA